MILLSLLSLKGVWGYRSGAPVGIHSTSHSASSSLGASVCFQAYVVPRCRGPRDDQTVLGKPKGESKLLSSFYLERSGSQWVVVA